MKSSLIVTLMILICLNFDILCNKNSNENSMKVSIIFIIQEIKNNSSVNQNIQNEYLAFSDYKCVFKCEVAEDSIKDLKDQYLSLLDNKSEINLSDITKIDLDYYCINIKPKYVVKL